MALGGGAQASVASDGAREVQWCRVSAGQKVVRAHAEPAAEPHEKFERGCSVADLYARDMLVGDAQLHRELLLGELERFPSRTHPAGYLDFGWSLHDPKRPSGVHN